MGKNFDLPTSKYENFINMGGFNAEPSETAISDFVDIQSEKFSKTPCFKYPYRNSYIDPILTSKRKSFQPSIFIETGISDFFS